jgi:membrane-associated phospholipid phosphatase
MNQAVLNIPRPRLAMLSALILIWVIAVIAAISVDSRVERAVLHVGPMSKDSWPARIIRTPGRFQFTLVIAILLGLCHRLKWRAGLLLCLSGIPVGLFYVAVKWAFGRYRPPMPGDVTIPPHTPWDFLLFRGGFPALWRAQAMGFPSGHTLLAFATATILGRCFPRFRYLFYLLAVIVGIERIAEYTHYFSDVVAGAGLGILAAHLTVRLLAGLLIEPSAGRGFEVAPKET